MSKNKNGRVNNPHGQLNKQSNNTKKQSAKARCFVTLDGQDGEFTGQVARTLLSLKKAGGQGITALEVSSWAFRLASYVFILRRDYKLTIETRKEEHSGGWHARYILHTPVTVKLQGGQHG